MARSFRELVWRRLRGFKTRLARNAVIGPRDSDATLAFGLKHRQVLAATGERVERCRRQRVRLLGVGRIMTVFQCDIAGGDLQTTTIGRTDERPHRIRSAFLEQSRATRHGAKRTQNRERE